MLWIPQFAFAGWPGDPTAAVPICTDPGTQDKPAATSDGAGGAIITWQDSRSGHYRVYAQRVDADGNVLWATDGVRVCMDDSQSAYQDEPQIASDGAGGAIITWQDHRKGYVSNPYYSTDFDIYAQRIDANGNRLWAGTGVLVCGALGSQRAPKITSDGYGGAAIAWVDRRSLNVNSKEDIYAQRINANGSRLWAADGVAICTSSETQWDLQLVSDGSGGAIITWDDRRHLYNPDIYAQRVSSGGSPIWGGNGRAICTAQGGQASPQLVSDGSGGAIITWQDSRDHSNNISDIYVQRVNSSGSRLWQGNGVPIEATAGSGYSPRLVSDGSGGAIIVWRNEAGGEYNIHAQRVDANNGSRLWATDGVPICAAPGHQSAPQLVSDGADGAIITWSDGRTYGSTYYYAQRVDANSNVQWTADGVPINGAAGYPDFVSDGSGGAIMAWRDSRSGNADIYARRVESNGLLGMTITSFSPDTGPTSGGTLVTLGGYKFGSEQGSGSVTFDGQAATITNWSDAEVICETPAHAPGVVDVVLTTDAGDSYTKPAVFTYIGIAVFCLTPPEGSPSGGTQVTIDGLVFGSERGSGSVTFGGQAATIVNWSEDRIVCTTPPHAAGVVDVVVTNNDGDSDTASFIYAKMVTSIAPDTGPSAGGTEVTIGGIEFGSVPGSGSVTFDGQVASIVTWSDTEIVCTTPPHAAGVVEVVVTNGDGVSDTSAFTYTGQMADGTQKWKFTTALRVESSPVIGSDGTIYVGAQDYKLYALNPDGTQKWVRPISRPSASITIGPGGTIYVGSDDKNLYAINPDGTQKWAFPTEGWVYSSPAIGSDGTIYVGGYYSEWIED